MEEKNTRCERIGLSLGSQINEHQSEATNSVPRASQFQGNFAALLNSFPATNTHTHTFTYLFIYLYKQITALDFDFIEVYPKYTLPFNLLLTHSLTPSFDSGNAQCSMLNAQAC